MMIKFYVCNGLLNITPNAFFLVTIADKGHETRCFAIVFLYQAATVLREKEDFVAETA